jgi:Bacterial mobilisation protein (MobC)
LGEKEGAGGRASNAGCAHIDWQGRSPLTPFDPCADSRSSNKSHVASRTSLSHQIEHPHLSYFPIESPMPRAKVKTKRFAMRVAPAVLDDIDREAAAAKLTRTQYLIDGRSKPVNPPEALYVELYAEISKLQRELKAQGNNLNQIAHVLNSHALIAQKPNQAAEAERLVKEMFQLSRTINLIKAALVDKC